MFDFPSDPNQSEDDNESDEEETSYNATKLKRILEEIDDPGLRSTEAIRVSPQPSTSSADILLSAPSARVECPSPLPEEELSNGHQVAREIDRGTGRRNGRGIGWVRGRVAGRGSTRDENDLAEAQVDLEENASDEDEDMWKKSSWTADRPEPDIFDSIPLSPTRMLPSNARPIRHFEKNFTQDVFELIVRETNLYASQNNILGWTEIDIKELKAFFGIIIIMGYNILPSMELYWSSDPAFRVDEIASTMPYRRFKLILRCLHLNDNSKQPLRSSPDYDKLFKIRPLVTLLNSTFQNNANNSSSQSIDESMIVFKGRSSLKQYMPLKPIKRGFKVWCRCDSSTGYLYEFDIYTGKDGDRVEDNLGAKVVTKLTEKLTGMGAVHVTFDNFFCGYEIMKSLFDNCIYASGTVRRQRADLPKIVKSKKKLKLKKGEHKWRVKGDVAFVIWQDTKEVLFLTNAFHPNVNITSVTRTQKDGTKTDVGCPAVVKQYTKRMGGVDHFDHIKGTYSVGRRSRRWWLRIFYFLLDACITNAFILYSKIQIPQSFPIWSFA
ncbi:PiggyBac transposable element-derived protein 4 [Eumeta japonica]|uniref:PiggyBac transposable element-derived protein 4 n=2 Tax=Eumeta variegata TaxID=151549 RepID=A0A4C1UYH1_EUMVA|nr:PiggyBac transposable element-derived protein 4 [Eumeta japonica]